MLYKKPYVNQGVIFIPQHNTPMLTCIQQAVEKAKALKKEIGYGFLTMKYHDFYIGINEKVIPHLLVKDLQVELKIHFNNQKT